MDETADIHATDLSSEAESLTDSDISDENMKWTPPPRSSFLHSFFAPWRYAFRPRKAAEAVCNGSVLAAICGFVFVIVLNIIVIGFAVVLAEMFYTVWSYPSTQSEVYNRSFFEVINQVDLLDVAALLAGVSIPIVIGTIILAWVQFPIIHRHKSAWASYGRSFGAVIAALGTLSILAGIDSVLIALGDYVFRIALVDNFESALIQAVQFGFFLLIIGSVAAAMIVVDQAARGAVDRSPIVDPILHCEICSYDLAHLPESGRCTECGEETAISTSPYFRRKGIDWESSPTVANWGRAVWMVLRKPAEFYQQLHMQEDDRNAWHFARINYFLVASLTIIGFWCFLPFEEYIGPSEAAGIGMIAGMVTLCLAWGWHRALGALACTSIVARGLAPDFYRVKKIWLYESAMIWPMWAFQMFLFLLTWIDDNWLDAMAELFAPQFKYVLPPFVILGEISLFMFLTLIRYTKAVKITRWSNF